jgi:hypothetical protein
MCKVIYFCFLLLFFQKISADKYDVIIYGATSAGVMAGVQVARMGYSVAVIEPGNHVGGMTSNGLGWVDISKPQTIGGLAKEYFHRIWEHYQRDDAWKWEPKRFLTDQMGSLTFYKQTMWLLEPHVGELIFENMIKEGKVSIIRSERLNRTNGVHKSGSIIQHIVMESGRKFEAKIFIDCSYEGDLMAAAGVSYFVGREANSLYGETNNGVHTNYKRSDLPKNIPADCLFHEAEVGKNLIEGEEDSLVQSYNYRMCLTNVPENTIMIEKPHDYDEREYELLFRIIAATPKKYRYFKLDMLPNKKTDSNNYGPISTDYVGKSWNYAEASYAEREVIAKAHQRWQRGLVWTLQNHPRVLEHIRTFYSSYGLPKDEFADNNHWPYQLYIRESRRMVSDVVITENTALGKNPALDSIGLGSYHMDSHIVRYVVAPDGFLATEGCLFIKVPRAFPISYQSIIPKSHECQNLLVPVCLSTSHVAFGSIRMEPTYMVLGQSAATAAVLCIEHNIPVQELPYETLKKRLISDGQVLEWNLD